MGEREKLQGNNNQMQELDGGFKERKIYIFFFLEEKGGFSTGQNQVRLHCERLARAVYSDPLKHISRFLPSIIFFFFFFYWCRTFTFFPPSSLATLPSPSLSLWLYTVLLYTYILGPLFLEFLPLSFLRGGENRHYCCLYFTVVLYIWLPSCLLSYHP